MKCIEKLLANNLPAHLLCKAPLLANYAVGFKPSFPIATLRPRCIESTLNGTWKMRQESSFVAPFILADGCDHQSITTSKFELTPSAGTSATFYPLVI